MSLSHVAEDSALRNEDDATGYRTETAWLRLMPHEGGVAGVKGSNMSARGFGFASEHPFNDGPESLWVTFRQPGLARPIEALGRVAWQGPEATVGNVWGCELLDMSPGCREIFERVLANTA